MAQVRSLIKGPSIEVVLREGLRYGCAGRVHPAMGDEAMILPRCHRTRSGLRDHHRTLYKTATWSSAS